MRAAAGVNRRRWLGCRFAVSQKKQIAMRKTEHVDAPKRTLAPESGHIVAFKSSGTTSRAAFFDPLTLVVRRTRSGAFSYPARAKGFRPQGIFKDLASRRRPQIGRRDEKE